MSTSSSDNALTNAFPPPLATLVRGAGCYVWDTDGKQYLDFLGGIAVNALGHAHPAFVEAVSDQAATLGHISNFFVSEPQLELARRLVELADMGEGSKAFFTNSGTEALEAAFKLARLHGSPLGKTRMLALDGGFHGRTMGALALTAKEQYRAPFRPMPGNIDHIEPTVSALEAAMGDDVAAIFVEPIQGEAGVRPLPVGFLSAARRLATEHDALLVLDEVQTGVARTGLWFEHHRTHRGSAPVRADILTLAKGLGGGFPIGAVLMGQAAAELFYPGAHGTTFGGNPLACRAALAVLDTIETRGLLENAQKRGNDLRNWLLSLESNLIDEVTGDGLLLGVQLSTPVAPIIASRSLELGLIVNAPRETTIRLAPPLIVGEPELAQFQEIFAVVLAEVG